MSIWILTTGNSDVILKHDRTWGRLHDEASHNLECSGFGSASRINPDDKEAGYTVPARILGLVYANQSEEYYKDDLKFPLLDTYSQYLTDENIKIERIIVLLTDQSQIFSSDEQRLNEFSPYWKDTCTLQPLLEWYFKNAKFACQPEFQYLVPHHIDKGVDNWDATLSLVEAKLTELDIDVNQEVYVSHQAGTPAISSAVQFVTIGKFKKVQFLVSNEYFNEDYELKAKSDTVESSRYQRGMQIQKAKQLIIDGFPGAALKMLEKINEIDKAAISELKDIVDFFNLYTPSIDDSEDLAVPQATQRIVDTLDLIGFFFNQKNYLPGIALLAAAQETFLKVAILSQVATINETININGNYRKVSELIKWIPFGLFLDASVNNSSISDKMTILKKLNFPVNSFKFNTDKDFEITNRNFGLIAWLKSIDNNFGGWDLLIWCCSKRDADDDLRNQLMHNLRGVKDSEVINYLLAYKNHQVSDVMTAYNHHVKQHFLKAIDRFQLPYKRDKLAKRLQKIADSIR
ncbi:hypothetical protein Cylst_4166 [Cylindrospermum stagnale PCC 7417]|uniref:Uncharacterized protein n=1 Tax=Cylindrospermum stagnale PCC 7417 TaxID=56107 RepID=K9X0X5_9NOST|nr:hypothetical protein [Cylindrospermum stagnale]AFZ26270.1 hypothetical protein Cylst_4166 [Cylindrospermum stagnale PCC 7417]